MPYPLGPQPEHRRRLPGMQSFGYTTVNYLESANGQCAAVETATQLHHLVMNQRGLPVRREALMTELKQRIRDVSKDRTGSYISRRITREARC